MKEKMPFLVLIIFLLLGCDNHGITQSKSNSHFENGRYQIYSMGGGAGDISLSIPLLLDTKTGKIWKFYHNQSTGKMGFEGLTVEGLAYSSVDLENFYNTINKMEMEGLSEKDKKQLRNDIIAEFSYVMDADKTKKVGKRYYNWK